MATHRIYGYTRVAGQPVSRRVDVIDAAAWAADGVAAATVGTVVSSALDGSWEVLLDSDALVLVLGAPVAPHAPMMVGPIRPEAL
jgi:hypothetical protein